MIVVAVLGAACGPSGSGNIVSEVREVGEFESIEVSGGIDLRLTVDPGATDSVVVVYDDNLLDQIVTEVNGSTLVIGSEGSFNILGSGRVVEVTASSLERLSASGGSEVDVTGGIETLSLEASGGSDVDASDLTVVSMRIEASGGADVTVNVTGEVSGSASGGADVTVLGEPGTTNIDVSGGADVDPG